MTRISTLFVATTLAILPLSAFAQTAATAPTKTTAAVVSDAKTPVQPTRTDMHSLNNHHDKTGVPAKSAEPTKS